MVNRPGWRSDLLAALGGSLLAVVLLWYIHGQWQPGWALACGIAGAAVRRWIRPAYSSFPSYVRLPLSIGMVALGTLIASWATLATQPLAYWLLRWREAVTLPIIGSILGLGLAAVIYTYRRLEQEVEANRRMEEDLQVARRIQRSLLGSTAPDLGWLEAHAVNRAWREVGGDYYEFIPAPDSSMCFAVGDVSGKGVPAALLMSSLQSAFLAAHSVLPDLAQVCGHVNRFLVQRTTPERYASFFVGHLTPSGQLIYVNAGLTPPLLIGANGPDRLFGGGLPLGLFDWAEYVVHRRAVDADDVLVVYTDGVTEAANEQEEEFGEERLARVIASHRGGSSADISAAILDAMASHAGSSQAQVDDVTLMVLRVREIGG